MGLDISFSKVEALKAGVVHMEQHWEEGFESTQLGIEQPGKVIELVCWKTGNGDQIRQETHGVDDQIIIQYLRNESRGKNLQCQLTDAGVTSEVW